MQACRYGESRSAERARINMQLRRSAANSGPMRWCRHSLVGRRVCLTLLRWVGKEDGVAPCESQECTPPSKDPLSRTGLDRDDPRRIARP